ncbi:MAG: cytochrome c biogenesis protein CcsA [Gaiellales bacterium]
MGGLALVLFWPAVLAYSEAALAYAGETIRPGRPSRYAIWGVRLGWLAQTALLVTQASAAEGFPWSSWAGSLNLFVWMCVSAYLIWGCRAPFRLLGLAVMPPAAVLLAIAGAAGAARTGSTGFGTVFLAAHVGLVLAAFAGFTIAAGLAGVYLWQERALKRRSPRLLRVRAPSLTTLDTLIGRTILVALPALTIGIGIGFARLQGEGVRLDGVIVATLVAWFLYAAFLLLRHEAGWHGRRAAQLALGGFAIVVAVRAGAFAMGHF